MWSMRKLGSYLINLIIRGTSTSYRETRRVMDRLNKAVSRPVVQLARRAHKRWQEQRTLSVDRSSRNRDDEAAWSDNSPTYCMVETLHRSIRHLTNSIDVIPHTSLPDFRCPVLIATL